jgi:hypothetical protein
MNCFLSISFTKNSKFYNILNMLRVLLLLNIHLTRSSLKWLGILVQGCQDKYHDIFSGEVFD